MALDPLEFEVGPGLKPILRRSGWGEQRDEQKAHRQSLPVTSGARGTATIHGIEQHSPRSITRSGGCGRRGTINTDSPRRLKATPQGLRRRRPEFRSFAVAIAQLELTVLRDDATARHDADRSSQARNTGNAYVPPSVGPMLPVVKRVMRVGGEFPIVLQIALKRTHVL
jgi:hypothetical protein